MLRFKGYGGCTPAARSRVVNNLDFSSWSSVYSGEWEHTCLGYGIEKAVIKISVYCPSLSQAPWGWAHIWWLEHPFLLHSPQLLRHFLPDCEWYMSHSLLFGGWSLVLMLTCTTSVSPLSPSSSSNSRQGSLARSCHSSPNSANIALSSRFISSTSSVFGTLMCTGSAPASSNVVSLHRCQIQCRLHLVLGPLYTD